LSKKPELQSPTSNSVNAVQPPVIDLSKPHVQQSIKIGKAVITEGKSKADAARAMYDLIKDEHIHLIAAAFVEGAALTPKGALTYVYNCRRWASRKRT